MVAGSIAYEASSMPLALLPNGHGAASPCEIGDLTAANGVRLGRAHEVAVTSTADTAVAKLLEIAAGSGVTVLDRLVHTDAGQPIEWRVSYVRA
jgi:DNA-binding GntR family transcriptional regulator